MLTSLNTLRASGTALVAGIAAMQAAGDETGLGATRAEAIGNIATALEGAENASVPNVMAYGAARSILQFALNHDAASLDKADKAAIGWKDMASTSPAKRRVSQYHSRFRRIAEDWETIPESERNELLAGTRSFLSVYDGIVKREKAADKAKADAETADKAEAAIAEAKAEGKAEAATESGLLSLIEAAIAAYPTASDEEKALAFDLVGELVDLANANAPEVEQAEAA